MLLKLFLTFATVVLVLHVYAIRFNAKDLRRGYVKILAPENLLIIATAIVMLVPLVSANFRSVYLLVLPLLLILHFYRDTAPYDAENQNIKRNILLEILFPILVFFGIAFLKTGGTFLVQQVAHFGDHYFYSKIANGVFATGHETYNLGYAYADIVDTRPYHYFELYFSSLVSYFSGLPTLLIFEYVFIPLAIYLAVKLLIPVFQLKHIWVILLGLVLVTFFPSLGWTFERFIGNAVYFREAKMLVVLIFLIPAVKHLLKGEQFEFVIYSTLLALIYPTTLFAVAFMLIADAAQQFVTGKWSLRNRKMLWPILGLVYLGIFIVLVKISEKQSTEYTSVESLNASFISAYISEFIRLVRVYGIMLVKDFLPMFIFSGLLFWSVRKSNKDWSAWIVTAAGIAGAFAGSAYFYGRPDGAQILTNFFVPLLIAMSIYYLVNFASRWLVIPVLVLFIGYVSLYFIAKPIAVLPDSQIAACERYADEEMIGVVRDSDIFLGRHFSNTMMNNVNKEIHNYSNVHLVNVNPIDGLLNDKLPADVLTRLQTDEMYQYCKTTGMPYEEYLKKFNVIFSTIPLEEMPLYDDFMCIDEISIIKDYTSEADPEYVDCFIYSRMD